MIRNIPKYVTIQTFSRIFVSGQATESVTENHADNDILARYPSPASCFDSANNTVV